MKEVVIFLLRGGFEVREGVLRLVRVLDWVGLIGVGRVGFWWVLVVSGVRFLILV